MKNEEAIDWREIFPQLPLDKENKLRRGHGKLRWEEFFLSCFSFGRRRK
jgi:hypothetical protein